MVKDRNKNDAKRECARRVLEQLKDEVQERPEIDEIISLEKEIEYFYDKLQDKNRKPIEALLICQKNDGRSGKCFYKFCSIFWFCK